MRNAIYIMVIVVVAAVSTAEAETVFYSFWELIPQSGFYNSIRHSLDIGGGVWDNLKRRMDPNDLSGASDVFVEKTGYNDSTGEWVGDIWEIGFSGIYMGIDYPDEEWFNGDEYFSGYASNNNYFSNTFPLRGPGWCMGYTDDWVLSTGSRITNILIIHDRDRDGIAYWNGYNLYVNASELPSTEDNEAFRTRDVLFGENQLRGNILQIPVVGSSEILPKMVISPYRAYDPMYLDSVRVDFAAVPDLLQMAAYWLMSGADRTNGWMQGADWNLDGTVNMADFYRMSAKWNPPQAQDN